MTEVKAVKAGDKYDVSFSIESKKFSADSLSKETVVPSENYVEVGIYKNKSSLIQLNMYKLKQGITKMKFSLNEKPYKVVIDPRLLLIDKKLDDNEMKFDDERVATVKK
jgi:ABC-2 type transport system permease protein